MTDVVVQTRALGKRYLLGQEFQSYDTLRDAVSRALSQRRQSPRHEIWALRDVDLDVKCGEVLGIVGANGVGKTTLLKVVSRITTPTTGLSRTRGHVGALLEVGTGFHPELTGRENIMLGGAVLGMRRRAALRRFDDVVEFAGLERFLDTPLKRYSSGMRLRLAFAVAAHFDADVLAIDEVLAVGDAEFQRRCLDKMSEVTGVGRTALFVSHDLGAVTRLCSRAIWLDNGQIKLEGPAPEVVRSYLHSTRAGAASVRLPYRDGAPAAVRAIALIGPDGSEVSGFERDEELCVRAQLRAKREVPGLDVSMYLVNERGVRVFDEGWLDRADAPPLPTGDTELTLRIAGFLAPGGYVLYVWTGDPHETFQEVEAVRFEILPRPDDRIGVRGERVTQPQVQWSAQHVQVESLG
jgi:ABC-2 type transport system ATP-binding protein/lipopolysaccharide transport system ATP-binding protein